jgi:hypothetical protein
VSVTTTSVSGILSMLSAGLLTTIVPMRTSGRVPKPIFGLKPIFRTGRAHLDLVPARVTAASPHELHVSDVRRYRTDRSASDQASQRALLLKALHYVD